MDLDGKQGDIAYDPVVKLDSAEGALKGELDPLAGDFKFFKVEGQGGSLIAKDSAYIDLNQDGVLEMALGQAVTDPAFRQELLDDSQSALAEYELSAEEVALLGQIDPDGLEQAAAQLKSQFESLEDTAAQTVLGRIITDVLSGGAGVVKGE